MHEMQLDHERAYLKHDVGAPVSIGLRLDPTVATLLAGRHVFFDLQWRHAGTSNFEERSG